MAMPHVTTHLVATTAAVTMDSWGMALTAQVDHYMTVMLHVLIS